MKQYDDPSPRTRAMTPSNAPPSGPPAGSARYPEEISGDPNYSDDGPWDTPTGGMGCSCCDSCSGGCPSNCCGDCYGDCCCGFPRRCFYGRAEVLAFFVSGSSTPPLVTTNPDGTPIGTAGRLPNSTVLFGGDKINGDGRPGGRFTLGHWFGDCDNCGIEDTFFFVGTGNQGFKTSSDVNGIIARPFFDTAASDQDTIFVAFPGLSTGSVTVSSKSKVFSNELNFRRVLYSNSFRRLDFIAGYRYMHLGDNLQIDTATVFTSSPPGSGIVVGTAIGSSDQFVTRNNFNGGQFGFVSEYYNGPWTFEWRAKLALGNVAQRATINGITTVSVPNGGGTTNNVGGLLALPSNIGTYSRNQFSVVPELDLNLHLQLDNCWKFTVGYTIMGITNVARAGDQIDLRVDSNQIPPPSTAGPFTSPHFSFVNSDVLIQGINLGFAHEF